MSCDFFKKEKANLPKEIKTISNKQKPRDYVTKALALKEILKERPQTEGKLYQIKI